MSRVQYGMLTETALQGDDYILYVHPKRQPGRQQNRQQKDNALAGWYYKCLRTSEEDGVVRWTSNLRDTYFVGGRDHFRKDMSAARMPSFEGVCVCVCVCV
jgi:hypothetical protein